MSRSDARSGALRRRPSRTIPAVIVALVLLTVAVAVVWVSAVRITSGTWPTFVVDAANWAHDVSFGSTTAITAAAAAAAVGLVVLLCAIIPGQYTALRVVNPDLEGGGGSTEVVMTRRSVARLATARADEIDGVGSVSTSAGARSVALSVTSPSSQRDVVGATVKERVRDALSAANVDPLPRVSVNVRTHR